MAISVDDPESPVEIAAFLHLGLAFPFGGRTPMQKLLYPSAGFGIAGSSLRRDSPERGFLCQQKVNGRCR
jgi:hypothetical protein